MASRMLIRTNLLETKNQICLLFCQLVAFFLPPKPYLPLGLKALICLTENSIMILKHGNRNTYNGRATQIPQAKLAVTHSMFSCSYAFFGRRLRDVLHRTFSNQILCPELMGGCHCSADSAGVLVTPPQLRSGEENCTRDQELNIHSAVHHWDVFGFGSGAFISFTFPHKIDECFKLNCDGVQSNVGRLATNFIPFMTEHFCDHVLTPKPNAKTCARTGQK